MVDVVEFQEQHYENEKCMALKVKHFLGIYRSNSAKRMYRASYSFRNNYLVFARFHSFGKFNLILFQHCRTKGRWNGQRVCERPKRIIVQCTHLKEYTSRILITMTLLALSLLSLCLSLRTYYGWQTIEMLNSDNKVSSV